MYINGHFESFISNKNNFIMEIIYHRRSFEYASAKLLLENQRTFSSRFFLVFIPHHCQPQPRIFGHDHWIIHKILIRIGHDARDSICLWKTGNIHSSQNKRSLQRSQWNHQVRLELFHGHIRTCIHIWNNFPYYN